MDALTSLTPFAIIAGLVIGYALGSIPFGLILTNFAGTSDIRNIGSGNIGATNVLRTGRKDLAAATLILDALKATAAVLIAWKLISPGAALVAGLAAFLGHLFPVWLSFKGGKGVATYIGILLAFHWPTALVFCAVWLIVAAVTRYSSASALAASLAAPIALFIFGLPPVALLMILLLPLLWWKHAGNIERLMAGTEGKIGAKG